MVENLHVLIVQNFSSIHSPYSFSFSFFVSESLLKRYLGDVATWVGERQNWSWWPFHFYLALCVPVNLRFPLQLSGLEKPSW